MNCATVVSLSVPLRGEVLPGRGSLIGKACPVSAVTWGNDAQNLISALVGGPDSLPTAIEGRVPPPPNRGDIVTVGAAKPLKSNSQEFSLLSRNFFALLVEQKNALEDVIPLVLRMMVVVMVVVVVVVGRSSRRRGWWWWWW